MRKYLLNFIVWLSLSVLVALAFFHAENKGEGLIYLLLIVAALKFIMIGFQFMELRSAHIAWPIWLSLLLAFYVIGFLSFAAP